MGQSKPFARRPSLSKTTHARHDCLRWATSMSSMRKRGGRRAGAGACRGSGPDADRRAAAGMDGVELAHIARKYNPEMVIVTRQIRNCPRRPVLVQAWAPLGIREAERVQSITLTAVTDVLIPSADLADRGRLPRHRRALHAGGGADARRAAGHRGGLRLHARDRAAYAGRHARARRGAAHQCPGVCGAEMVRRRLSALHGLAGAARDRRACGRHQPAPRRAPAGASSSPDS